MPGLENDSKREDSEVLPSYTARKETQAPAAATSSAGLGTGHSFSLKDSKGRSWLTLTVFSRAANDKSLPVFIDLDEIRGTVKANVEKPESCKGISISVCIIPSGALSRKSEQRAVRSGQNVPWSDRNHCHS